VALAWSGSIRSGGGAFEAFWIAAALSVVLAGFSLFLPNTQPLAGGRRPVQIGAVGPLLKTPAVAVYLVAAFCVSLTMPFVYQVLPTYLESEGLPRAWAASVLTLGQWPEILALAVLPWLLLRLGPKRTLMMGWRRTPFDLAAWYFGRRSGWRWRGFPCTGSASPVSLLEARCSSMPALRMIAGREHRR
jgi:hypothetical protein